MSNLSNLSSTKSHLRPLSQQASRRFRFNKILRGPDGDYPCGRDQDVVIEAADYQEARRIIQASPNFGRMVPGTRNHITYQIVGEEFGK